MSGKKYEPLAYSFGLLRDFFFEQRKPIQNSAKLLGFEDLEESDLNENLDVDGEPLSNDVFNQMIIKQIRYAETEAALSRQSTVNSLSNAFSTKNIKFSSAKWKEAI